MSRFWGCARIFLVSALSICAFVIVLFKACGAHTSDSKMISFFYQDESSFERLVTMAHEDAHIQAVTRDSVTLYSGENNWTIASPHVMPQARWDEYQRLLKELKLLAIAKGGQDVDFRFDNYSEFNGGSCKGFYYSLKPLPSCSTELSKCISTQGIDEGSTVNRLIKPHWYLYLHYS
jgi:hypothetical protein